MPTRGAAGISFGGSTFGTTTVFGSTTGAVIPAPPSFPIDCVGVEVGVGVGVGTGLMAPGENREKLGYGDVSEASRTETLYGLSWILKSRMLSVP